MPRETTYLRPDGWRTTGRRALVLIIVVSLTIPLAVGAGGPGNLGLLAGDAAASSSAAVDVVFVVDRSYSMRDELDALRSEMAAVDDWLTAAGADTRYLLVTYEGTPRVAQGWSSDYAAVDDSLAVTGNGHVENASAALLAASSRDFRSGAARVIVLVTDEDDDGTAAERAEAVEAMADVHLIAVSPANPAVSSCSERWEPCDSDADNELLTVADDVGGDWIDVGNDPTAVFDQVSVRVIEQVAGASVSTARGDDDGPSFSVSNTTLNRTTVAVGEAVEIRVTIENTGAGAGRFDALLGADLTLLEKRTVWVPGGENRTVRFVVAIDEPGTYELFVTYDHVGQLAVTPLRPTAVETSVEDGGSRVVTTVSDARSGDAVSVPLDGLEVGGDDPASLESFSITPLRDGDFSVRVTAFDEPPAGTGSLPAGVEPLTFLVANSSLTAQDIDHLTLRGTSLPDAVGVYHFDGDAGDWVLLASRTTGAGENATTITRSEGFSAFAVGVRHPSITVLDVTPGEAVVGEPVTATVLVENEGTVDGTVRTSVVAEGEVVTRANASVPAGQLRWLEVSFTPATTGTYRLATAGGEGHPIHVRPVTTTADPAEATPQATGNTRTPGQPGFGPAALAAALAVLGLMARARRGWA